MKFDLTGQRFGRLLVVKRLSNKPNGWPRWECACDCGKRTIKTSASLRNQGTKSCGCISSENCVARSFKHGLLGSPEYVAWQGMKRRCLNPKEIKYHCYGGRGIKVCERWLNSFENFLEDMGKKPTLKHSIDRIDNDGNYKPGNCRWATQAEQCNNKRTARRITLNGETLSLTQWAQRFHLPVTTLWRRLDKGMSLQHAVAQGGES